MTVSVQAREWTSSDGRKLQADYVSVAGADVVVKRADGQTMKIPLTRLSPADQAWVKDYAGKPAAPETAGTFKKVPLWLFHAADDATVEVDYSRKLAEELKRDKDCKYTEYPTGGHGIIGKVFEEEPLYEWLFAKGVKK